MAAHRKPRTRTLSTAAARGNALGVTTVALASVSLLAPTAQATPGTPADKPSLEDVQKQVDELYRQAGAETQRYNAATEKTEQQRKKVDAALDDVAEATDEANTARRALGRMAAAQYRGGGMTETATLLLSRNPQGYFDKSHMLDRMTARQERAVKDFEDRQESAGERRAAATKQLASLSKAQTELRESKAGVQEKLTEARKLLSELTAEEKARLAEIERRKRAEAERLSRERAAEAERRRAAAAEKETSGSGTQTEKPAPPAAPAGSSRVEKVLAFAKAQLGKPYVWGATGPNSYDCSGFTQDAWRAAGVEIPRVTYDQVDIGTKIPYDQMQPGDLVFFYEDVTHVGIYVGDGQMIHASKPGDDVKYEAVDYMPFHSAVRPG